MIFDAKKILDQLVSSGVADDLIQLKLYAMSEEVPDAQDGLLNHVRPADPF